MLQLGPTDLLPITENLESRHELPNNRLEGALR